MGRVVSRAFGVIGRNAGLFVGLTLLLSTAPQLVMQFLLGAPDPANPGRMWVVIGASFLVSIIGGYVLAAALSYVTVSDLSNEQPTFAKAIGVGLRYALPLFLLALVSIVGIYVGFLFLFVPGMILGTMWCVAAPAMVAEKIGVFASLGRSRALTKGSRWAIFGLLLVAVIITFMPLLAVPLLTGAFDNIQAGVRPAFGIGTVIQALLGVGATMILIAIVAAIYVELRAIKEGTSTDALASIFA